VVFTVFDYITAQHLHFHLTIQIIENLTKPLFRLTVEIGGTTAYIAQVTPGLPGKNGENPEFSCRLEMRGL
jgi:hypothetical protein